MPDSSALRLTLDLLIWLPVLVGGYAYVGYPLLLKLVAKLVARRRPPHDAIGDGAGGDDAGGADASWPSITLTVPCYNEARNIRQTLESLLALDYPADRRQIVVISDASTDGTDDIVREYAERGVDLLRLSDRRGKSAAENAAGDVARGEIIVNTDATIRILPHALRALVRAFHDPAVGVASGRDISVASVTEAVANAAATATTSTGSSSGESGYVGYEMGIRALETRVGSIVGASGCFYGIRRALYDGAFPESLSRDFASALMVRERGYRAVSVDAAVCFVPRTSTLASEFRRKIRTMARGLQTLWFKRALLDPVRYGSFAWMLWSHKLCRWLVYPLLPVAAVALIVRSTTSTPWRLVLAAALCGLALGVVGILWPKRRPVPGLLGVAAFALASNVAGVLAWWRVLRNQRAAVWEPTRR